MTIEWISAIFLKYVFKPSTSVTVFLLFDLKGCHVFIWKLCLNAIPLLFAFACLLFQTYKFTKLTVTLIIWSSKEKVRRPRKKRRERKNERRKKRRLEKMGRLKARSTITKHGTKLKGTKKMLKTENMTRRENVKLKILTRVASLRSIQLVPRILLIVPLTAITATKGRNRTCLLMAGIILVSVFTILP